MQSEQAVRADTLPGTMRAAVVTAPGQIEMREVARPVPGPGQVRFRVEGCGVCASNLGPWSGPEWMEFPLGPGALGHEAWGVADEVGPGVEDIAPGDRIAALSYNAYAEFDIADAGAVLRLPEELDGLPFPAEPLACAVNIFRRSAITAGDTVAIIGIGFQGALLTQMAKASGASVIAISRRAFSLDVARDMGAGHCIRMDDHQRIIDEVSGLTNGEFCDCVIEAVGAQWPIDLAAELTKVRGRLVIAGYHQDGLRQVNMQLWNWRGLDVINAHERDPELYMSGMRAAVEKIRSGEMNPWPLFTHKLPLSQLDKALDMTRDRPDGFVKALVIP